MKIERITILASAVSTDTVFLHTDLPCGTYPYIDLATPRFDVASLTGEKYVKKHFLGIPYEVVSL